MVALHSGWWLGGNTLPGDSATEAPPPPKPEPTCTGSGIKTRGDRGRENPAGWKLWHPLCTYPVASDSSWKQHRWTPPCSHSHLPVQTSLPSWCGHRPKPPSYLLATNGVKRRCFQRSTTWLISLNTANGAGFFLICLSAIRQKSSWTSSPEVVAGFKVLLTEVPDGTGRNHSNVP